MTIVDIRARGLKQGSMTIVDIRALGVKTGKHDYSGHQSSGG